mgnify:CR=1 FL=1
MVSLAPVTVAVVALVVTGAGAWIPGLWYDEFVTMTSAQRSWPSLWAMLGHVDAVHGVYYATVKAWGMLFGFSPLAIRFPSVLAVALTALLLVKMGQQLWGLVPGVTAGLVYVLIPRTLWMGPHARSYAIAAFAITLAAFLLVRALTKDRSRDWLLFGLGWGLAISTFIYNALLLPVFLVVGMLGREWRKPPPRLLLSLGGGLIGAAPVLVVAISQRGQIGWIKLLTVRRALSTPYYMFLDGTDTLVGVGGWGALIGLALTLTIASVVRPAQQPTRSLDLRAAGVLTLGWLTVPPLTLVAVGFVLPLYYDHYVAISTPAVALLFAAAIARTGSRVWVACVTVALAAALAWQPWADSRQPNSKTNVLDVVAAVGRVAEAGDHIWFAEGADWSTRQLRYGYPSEFAPYHDLTLDRDFEEVPDFFGTSLPLPVVEQSLRSVDRVVVIVNQPEQPQPYVETASRMLDEAGLERSAEEMLPGWSVALYRRG